MKVSDLKNINSENKYILLKQQNDINSLGKDIIEYLSSKGDLKIKTLIATKANFEDIILKMIYNESNWKYSHLMSVLLDRDIISTENRLKIIKSKIWQKPNFPLDSVKFQMTKDLYFAKESNNFVSTIIELAKESSIPISFFDDALWDATDKQLLELMELIPQDKIYILFNNSKVQQKLTQKEFKNIAYKKLNIKILNKLDPFFFSYILDNKLYNRFFKNKDITDIINLQQFEAILKNKDLINTTNEEIFYSILGKNIIEFRKSLKDKNKYNFIYKLLSNSPLNTKINKLIIEYISEAEKFNSYNLTDLVSAYLKNPEIDSKNLEKLVNKYIKKDPSLILISVNSNKAISDKNVLNVFDNILKDNDKEIIDFFIRIMQVSSTPPRRNFIEKVWKILIDNNSDISTETKKEALNLFFNDGSSLKWKQKNNIPYKIKIEKGFDYFKRFKKLDYFIYDDSLLLDDLKDIWKELKDIKISYKLVDTENNLSNIKLKILEGKYRNYFAPLYYKETGDNTFLSNDIKEIFFF